jgi:hypothetical protein
VDRAEAALRLVFSAVLTAIRPEEEMLGSIQVMLLAVMIGDL